MSAPSKTRARRSPGAADKPEIGPAPASPAPDALGPLRGVVRRWPVVLLVTVLAVAAALVAAELQSPTYSASADINVGRVDVRVQTLPGYVAGAQALAAAYSRIATSDAIVDPLAKRLGTTPADVRSRLAASPVPDSTIFRIYASGGSEQSAVELARAGAAEMERYVAATATGETAVNTTLDAFREQARLAASYRQRIERLKALQSATPSPAATATATATPSRRTRTRRNAEIERLQVALDTAQLKMQALGGRYQERGNELAATAGIQVINRPTVAASDRGRTRQRLAAMGLIGGLLLGAALVALYDRRRTH